MVHFEDPRFEVRIKHDVETEDLKTHRVLNIVWLAATVDVRKLWLHCADSLNYDSTDISLNLLHIMSFISEVPPNESQTSFVPDTIIVFTFVLYKFLAVLIYRIISQMHV